MATTKEKWQEIANRGLQDKFDPATRAKFDEAVRRGLITMPQAEPTDTQVELEGIPTDENLQAEQARVETPEVSDIPTEENLQADQLRAAQVRDKKASRDVWDYVEGIGEAALTTTTGATGGALGFGVGSIEGAIGELTGAIPRGEAERVAQERAESLTYAPRSEVGQEIVGDIAEVAGVLPPILGTTPISVLRAAVPGKQITKATLGSPKARKALLVEQIKSGNPNVDNVAKIINQSGRVVTNKTSQNAVKLLSKSIGEDRATGFVAVAEKMTPASKRSLGKMLDIIEKGKKEPLFGQENRPSDILGDAVANRAKAISKLNTQASKQIGSIAKGIKKDVDISAPTNNFIKSLQDMGVTFERGDDGWVTPDFSRSKFTGGSQKDMTVLINDLLNESPSFEKAHGLKRDIRSNLDFDPIGPNKLKGDSQKLLKDLSKGIDEVLDSTSPAYRKANEKFAATVELKDRFNKLAGKDVDLFKEGAEKALGGKARRLVSNAESRVSIGELIKEAESTLGNYGVRFKDDIPSLNYAVTQLEDMFKIEPPGSFQGRIERAITSNKQGGVMSRTGDVIVDKVQEFRTPDFKDKMKSLRSLINQKQN